MTSIEPPFTYNPISKPKKSILKQQTPNVSNSWLSKFSSQDNSITTTTTSSLVQTPPQKTFGLLRKFINNVNNSQTATTATTTPTATNNKFKNDLSQTNNNIENEELSSTELRRVRFSVNRLTVEYFPYVTEDTENNEESQENKPNIETNETIINNNSSNDNSIININSNNNNNKNICKNDIKTTPRKVLAYYELACKNKEEPMIETLVSTLMVIHKNIFIALYRMNFFKSYIHIYLYHIILYKNRCINMLHFLLILI